LIATAWTILITVAARFIWGSLPLTFRAGSARLCENAIHRRPGKQHFFLSFTGVRGVVSLAAALAIPYALANGQPFPPSTSCARQDALKAVSKRLEKAIKIADCQPMRSGICARAIKAACRYCPRI